MKKGWVSSSRANVRMDPIPIASVSVILDRGDTFKILKKTQKKVAIGSHRDHWYLVRLENGIEGWIYGISISTKKIVDSPPKP